MSKNEDRLPLGKMGYAALVEEKEKVWFIRLKTNELCEFDRENQNVKILKRFEDAPGKEEFLYLPIEKVGDILVLGPGTAPHAAFYNLADGTCEYMELVPVENDRKVKRSGTLDFYKSYTCGDSVYLMGYEYPAILKINVGTGEAVYLTDWVVEVERRIYKVYASMGYLSDYVIMGKFVWMLCECAHAILRLDLGTDEIVVFDICSDLDIQCGICYDGNFWVAGNDVRGNSLLKYDAQLVLEKEIEVYPAKDGKEDYVLPLNEGYWATYPIIDLGEKLLLFSVYPSHVYEFDKASEQVDFHPVFEKLLEAGEERLYDLQILAPRRRGNFLCFLTGSDFLWNEYDFVHDILTRYEVRAECDEEFLQEYSKVLSGRTMAENCFVWNLGYKLTLPRFLEHTKYIASKETIDIGEDADVGARVHKKCWEAADQ